MKIPYILNFDSKDANSNTGGNKGASLAKLRQAGFLIPSGFIVTTEAYHEFISTNRIQVSIAPLIDRLAPNDFVALEQVSKQIQSLFESSQMPDKIFSSIQSAYWELSRIGNVSQRNRESHDSLYSEPVPLVAVAVRSSATVEDLPNYSFAGQYATFLNVKGTIAVCESVKKCWSSQWNTGVLSYLIHSKTLENHTPMAIVVQKMVAAESSGVAFTANPLTGRRDEIIIESNFGLGQSIVSGQIEPDHYVVDSNCWQITTLREGKKASIAILDPIAGTEIVTSDRHGQVLTNTQIVALAKEAKQIADYSNYPQDIEWAFADNSFYFLQTRPITSLYPLPSLKKPQDSLQVYYSFNSMQGVTDPLTPVGSEALQLVFSGLARLLSLTNDPREVLLVVGGRLYIDVTSAVGDPRLRRSYLSILSKIDPSARDIVTGLIEQGRFFQKKALTNRRLLTIFRRLYPILARAFLTLLMPAKMHARAVTEVERFIKQVEDNAAKASNLDSLIAAMEYDLSHIAEGIIVPIQVFFPSLLLISVIDKWLRNWLGVKPNAVLSMVRGLEGTVTFEMNLTLWSIAQVIRQNPAVSERVRNNTISELTNSFSRGELGIVQAPLDEFLAKYGMRAIGEIDIGRKRWHDDPTYVFQVLKEYIQLEDSNLKERLEDRSTDTIKQSFEYLRRVRALPFGSIRSKALMTAIHRMWQLSPMREDAKFYVIKVLTTYRTALLSVGRKLVASGGLVSAEDIFFIPVEGLKRFARGEGINLKGIVTSQRDLFSREETRRLMPRLLLSTGEAFYETAHHEEEGPTRLRGFPVSPGIVEGKVRVILDPTGVELKSGEIIVCRATDPGWTPLFLMASGLVMEVGGLVTHGSVVAREYGIPAVVGVYQATQRLKTGDCVMVDGSTGLIKVIDAS